LDTLLSDDSKSLTQKADVTSAVSRTADNTNVNSIISPLTTGAGSTVLNEGENIAPNGGPAEQISSSSRRKSRPSFERAKRAIDKLFSDGVPDQATVSNKKLCHLVSEELSEPVSSETILRAAGRRK
jgi:hypothetical protein